jgi:hypothetical protein
MSYSKQLRADSRAGLIFGTTSGFLGTKDSGSKLHKVSEHLAGSGQHLAGSSLRPIGQTDCVEDRGVVIYVKKTALDTSGAAQCLR